VKITWPHMGSIEVLLTSIFEEVGVDYILPPPSSQRTLELGSRHSPEFACIPLKTTTGNYMEAMEQGADTLLMIAGKGPCRFGFYAETQRRILEEAGYDANMVPLEFHLDKLGEVVGNIKLLKQGKSWTSLARAIRFAMHKAFLIDKLEQQALHQRCYDAVRGSTSRALRKTYKMVGNCGTYAELEKTKTEAMEVMTSVPRKENFDPVRIGIVGEFYLVLDPYFNLQVEEQLGDLGAYVERSVYLTDWLRPSGKNPVLGHTSRESEEAARPYLSHSVGGEGVHSVGHSVLFKRAGFDGVVHLLPFTCMPETIAKGILPLVSRDQGIPVISLVIDEQTGKAGVATRLEAFTDLARFRRRHAARSETIELPCHRERSVAIF
jgi:predicted nucleotide-binding protein (sugar kinase/HSP70/actin superfamily)